MPALAGVAPLRCHWLGSEPAPTRAWHDVSPDVGFRLGLAVRGGRGCRRGMGTGLALRRFVLFADRVAGQDQLRPLHVPRGGALARGHAQLRLPWFPNKEDLITIGTLALTVCLAAASYYAYERRFLECQRRWTRVPSRPV